MCDSVWVYVIVWKQEISTVRSCSLVWEKKWCLKSTKVSYFQRYLYDISWTNGWKVNWLCRFFFTSIKNGKSNVRNYCYPTLARYQLSKMCVRVQTPDYSSANTHTHTFCYDRISIFACFYSNRIVRHIMRSVFFDFCTMWLLWIDHNLSLVFFHFCFDPTAFQKRWFISSIR